MKLCLLLTATFLMAANVSGQEFVESRQTGKDVNRVAALSRGLVTETGAATRDFVTFRDRRWSILTLTQIAAATADAETSLHNFHRCGLCTETGLSRLVVGRRPDAHKYAIAGLFEIGLEAVAAHYVRNHGPARKWYWQYLWTLPQSISLVAHTRADFHNAALKLTCDRAGMNCF